MQRQLTLTAAEAKDSSNPLEVKGLRVEAKGLRELVQAEDFRTKIQSDQAVQQLARSLGEIFFIESESEPGSGIQIEKVETFDWDEEMDPPHYRRICLSIKGIPGQLMVELDDSREAGPYFSNTLLKCFYLGKKKEFEGLYCDGVLLEKAVELMEIEESLRYLYEDKQCFPDVSNLREDDGEKKPLQKVFKEVEEELKVAIRKTKELSPARREAVMKAQCEFQISRLSLLEKKYLPIYWDRVMDQFQENMKLLPPDSSLYTPMNELYHQAMGARNKTHVDCFNLDLLPVKAKRLLVRAIKQSNELIQLKYMIHHNREADWMGPLLSSKLNEYKALADHLSQYPRLRQIAGVMLGIVSIFSIVGLAAGGLKKGVSMYYEGRVASKMQTIHRRSDPGQPPSGPKKQK